jgi:hypothetical protein
MLTPWKNHSLTKFLPNPHLEFPLPPKLCASPCFEARLLAVPEFGLGHQVSKKNMLFFWVCLLVFLRRKQHCLILLFKGKFKGTSQSHGTFAF